MHPDSRRFCKAVTRAAQSLASVRSTCWPEYATLSISARAFAWLLHWTHCQSQPPLTSVIPLSPHPLLYLITNRQALHPAIKLDSREAWDAWHEQLALIGAAAQAGCQLIQIREKDLSAQQLTEFTRAAITVARPHGARVLVNDRLDVALAAGADGVHLRVSSLPVIEVKTLVTRFGLKNFLIGASTHSLTEAAAAETDGADFLVCGPVYDTLSKQSYGPSLGLDRLAEICRAVRLPVLAIGGVNLTNFREPLQHGASGIAAIGLFTERDTLRDKIEAILTSPTPR